MSHDFKVGYWRKRALKAALDRREDRSPINLWNGTKITKLPSDCFAIHNLFARVRPQVIIELGSSQGGSAAFFASFAKAVGVEQIISLDITKTDKPELPIVTWLTGDDTSDAIANQVRELVAGRKVSVIIDANHHGEHVAKELPIYGEMVSPGQALIMEDTHVDVLNFKKFREHGGPLRAFQAWLPDHPDFEQAEGIEPYVTTNYFGYWVRREA